MNTWERITALSFAAALHTGCVSTSSPKLKSEAAPPPHSMSIVLVRLTATVDNEPADALAGKTRICFGIANEDYEQTPELIQIRPVPVEQEVFKKDGWAYLLLKPGTYRLKIWDFGSAPYRLYVPPNRPLLYAGSVHGTCDPRSLAVSGYTLDFEPEVAQQVAQKEFGSIGSLTTARFQSTSTGSLCVTGNIFVTTRSTEKLELPHWSSRAAAAYANAVVVPPPPLEAGPFVFAYDLVAMPIAALAGAIEGRFSKHKWTPCVQELHKDLADHDPAIELQAVLLEQLRTNGMTQVRAMKAAQDYETPATGQGCKNVLQGEVRKVRLVQSTQRKLVGIEVSLHFRILDAQAENCFYDRDFLQKSGCHAMKNYSGEPGRALFRKQLTDAINGGVSQFLQDVVPVASVEEKTQLPNNP